MLPACSNIRVTDPTQTATEQFLHSQAALEAIRQLDFTTLRGRKVWVDGSYFQGSASSYAIAEVRARLLQAGGQIIEKRENAQIILEIRTPGVSIDRREFLLGIPSVVIPPASTASTGVPNLSTIITPEVALYKSLRQDGVAGIAYVAFWADSGEIVASSGPFIGHAYREDWWILGFGGKSAGNIPPVQVEN